MCRLREIVEVKKKYKVRGQPTAASPPFPEFSQSV